MWDWIVKLISGWIPTGQKPFGEWLGKIVWVIGIVLMVSLCTNVWQALMDRFFPPKPNVINVSGDYIQEKPDVMNFGCSLWRGYLKIGIKR